MSRTPTRRRTILRKPFCLADEPPRRTGFRVNSPLTGKMHPRVKPIAMVAEAILDSSRGGIVLDPFLGSGTDGGRAHQGRRCGRVLPSHQALFPTHLVSSRAAIQELKIQHVLNFAM